MADIMSPDRLTGNPSPVKDSFVQSPTLARSYYMSPKGLPDRIETSYNRDLDAVLRAINSSPSRVSRPEDGLQAKVLNPSFTVADLPSFIYRNSFKFQPITQ
jgi:hypothetical protein